MLGRLLRVQEVLGLLPYVLRQRPMAHGVLDAALEATILDRGIWKQIDALHKLTTSVACSLAYLEGDEATHSAIYACFLFIAVAVQNVDADTLRLLGVANTDVLMQAVHARFNSIYSASFALAFVTDPLFLDMRQRLTAVYGTSFVELGQGSLSEQCYSALDQIDSSPDAAIKTEFVKWMSKLYAANSLYMASRRLKPAYIWASMDDSALANLAPVLVQLHSNPTGAAGGERNHKTTKRVASAVRCRVGDCNIERQVAVAFNTRQLERGLATEREGKFIDRVVGLAATSTTQDDAQDDAHDDAQDDVHNGDANGAHDDVHDDEFYVVNDLVAFMEDYLREVDWSEVAETSPIV